MHPPDRELVTRFVTGGDEEAFRLLFRRHTPRVYAVALRLMAGRADDAEDVVQEMWGRAASRLGEFQWQSALSTWLTSIAINCARERLRQRPLVHADDDDFDVVGVAPAQSPTAIDLERAIAALPDRARIVLVLHDIEGHTHAEIARRLDIAAGTSKSHLFHARRLLRARLAAAAPAGVNPHVR